MIFTDRRSHTADIRQSSREDSALCTRWFTCWLFSSGFELERIGTQTEKVAAIRWITASGSLAFDTQA